MRWIFALAATAAADQASPVTKVVELLKDLKGKLELDTQTETKLYNKFACWCQKTTDRKIQSVKDQKKTIETEHSNALMASAAIGTLTAQIKKLNEMIQSNNEAMADRTNLRQKENGEFVYEKDETEEALGALQKAVEVLAGAGTAEKQPKKEELLAVTNTIKSVIGKVPDDAFDVTSMGAVQAFLQTGYAPQSGTVTGILKDMYRTFAANLQKETIDELTAQANFEAYIKKLTELNADYQATIDAKAEELANEEENLAKAQDTHATATEQLAADEKFLAETHETCMNRASDWDKRSSLRTEEIAGIDQAIGILSADSARNQFTVSADTFLQMNSVRRHLVAYMPEHRQQIAAIQAKITMGGHFDHVVKEIDAMILDLDKEDDKDTEQRDDCIKQTHEHDLHRDDLIYNIGRLQKEWDALNAHKEALEAEKKQVAADRAATEQMIDDARAQRTDDNTAWKQSVVDDNEAVKLLNSALDALMKFYKKNGLEVPGLLQEDPEFDVSEDQAPDVTDLDKNYGGRTKETGGILSILKQIVEDTERDVVKSTEAEKQAQYEFETAMATAKTSIQKADLRTDELNTEIAATKGTMQTTDSDKKGLISEKGDVEKAMATLKPGCDWINKTYHDRKTKRAAERQGLESAKATLTGAKTGFVQKDDDAVSMDEQAETEDEQTDADVSEDDNESQTYVDDDQLPDSFMQRRALTV